MDLQVIKEELQRRSNAYLDLPYLEVNYYRIRRKLAYPLPVREIHIPEQPIRGFDEYEDFEYPWAIWMLWALEERIYTLGWTSALLGDPLAREAALEDLEALAQWPTYRQFDRHDLALGHSARLLWIAHTQWSSWLPEQLQQKIHKALYSIVDDMMPISDRLHGNYAKPSDILELENPYDVLHNIQLIATLGTALAASEADHPEKENLNKRVQMIVLAMFEFRATGYSEGVAYDGYMLDFIVPWLSTLIEEERNEIVSHFQFERFLDESYMLGAPGCLNEVAQLSDVEPREMPFHTSAQAKLQALIPDTTRAWYLNQCKPEWLRADALAAFLKLSPQNLEEVSPPSGALDAHYALVLRDGWKSENLAIAMALSSSTTEGHIHTDNGSLVIGHAGQWFIIDPGYQQYMFTAERQFCIGPSAHNTPLINGKAQTKKRPHRLALKTTDKGISQMKIDLTECYDLPENFTSLHRTVWLQNDTLVVVADEIISETTNQIDYHWHGHAEGHWWTQDGWTRLFLNGRTLWITTPHIEITEKNIDRLSGSRGQLTLSTQTALETGTIWWVFSFGKTPPLLEISANNESLMVGPTTFHPTNPT
jgi:hypothetical protein